jgi:hypothetical protein
MKHLNMEARFLKELLKPQLKGMHCRKHREPTIIQFYNYVQRGDFGVVSFVSQKNQACCPEFEKRIRDNLGLPKR